MFLLVFQPNQSEFAVELRWYISTIHHPAKQHFHIHEQLRDNLINGKITVWALVRHYRLEIVVIVRTDRSIKSIIFEDVQRFIWVGCLEQSGRI